MRLREILKLVIAEIEDCGSMEEMIDYLRNDKEPTRYFYKDKLIETDHNLDEEISGKYYVFDECPHSPSMRLQSFNSIKEQEEYILSEAGYLNEFCGFCLAINDNKINSYEILYTNEEGSEVAFNKENQTGFGNKYNNARIKWM